MAFQISNYPSSTGTSRIPTTKRQTAIAPQTTLPFGSDTFSASTTTPKKAPKFSGWGTLLGIGLPLTKAALTAGRNSIDRSMKRDEYERNKRRFYHKKRTYVEDLGSKYRTVTQWKAYDYNDKRAPSRDEISYGSWHYRRRRYN